MPRKYSEDLRWRAVWQHCLQGKPVGAVARDLYNSDSSVERYVKLFTTTGEVMPSTSTQHRPGPKRKLSEFEEITVLQSLLDRPGTYLREVQEELHDITGTWIDCSICRLAKSWGLSRQKLARVAIQRSDTKMAEFVVEQFDPNMLLFVDETGSDRRNEVRRYGYSLKGITPRDYKLNVYGRRTSAIGVLSSRGIEDTYIVEDNVNGDIFMDFVQRSLLPIMLPFDGVNPQSVVVLDNAAIHHVTEVEDLIKSAGGLLRFLPPYCPQLNPIEEAFSKVKQYLRDNEKAYQCTDELRILLASAFASVSQRDCVGYMQHAGYPIVS